MKFTEEQLRQTQESIELVANVDPVLDDVKYVWVDKPDSYIKRFESKATSWVEAENALDLFTRLVCGLFDALEIVQAKDPIFLLALHTIDLDVLMDWFGDSADINDPEEELYNCMVSVATSGSINGIEKMEGFQRWFIEHAPIATLEYYFPDEMHPDWDSWTEAVQREHVQNCLLV